MSNKSFSIVLALLTNLLVLSGLLLVLAPSSAAGYMLFAVLAGGIFISTLLMLQRTVYPEASASSLDMLPVATLVSFWVIASALSLWLLTALELDDLVISGAMFLIQVPFLVYGLFVYRNVTQSALQAEEKSQRPNLFEGALEDLSALQVQLARLDEGSFVEQINQIEKQVQAFRNRLASIADYDEGANDQQRLSCAEEFCGLVRNSLPQMVNEESATALSDALAITAVRLK